MRSVAQIPPLTWRPQMEVSCSIWSRNTEVSCCLQTVWGNCRGLVARPVLLAGPSGRSGVTAAASAKATLLSVNFALGTPIRTDDSPGIRTQRPGQRYGSWSATPSEPAPELPYSGRRSDRGRQAAARRASPGFSDGTSAMRGVSIRYGLGRKPGRRHERSPVLGGTLSIPLSPAPCRNPETCQQELGAEATDRCAEQQGGCRHSQTNSAGNEPAP